MSLRNGDVGRPSPSSSPGKAGTRPSPLARLRRLRPYLFYVVFGALIYNLRITAPSPPASAQGEQLPHLYALQEDISADINFDSEATPSWKLAVCAVIQNEARFIDEWITYHRLVGVEHFFLYNSQSSDDTEDRVLPYVAAGLVTLHNSSFADAASRDVFQILSLRHCQNKYSHRVDWLAHYDTDEFLVHLQMMGVQREPYLLPPEKVKGRKRYGFPMHDILNKFRLASCRGLAVYRSPFINEGVMTLADNQTVLQTHKYRISYTTQRPTGTKSFIHTGYRKDLASFRETHSMRVLEGNVGGWSREIRTVQGVRVSDDDGYYDGSGDALSRVGDVNFATEPFHLAHYQHRDMTDCYFKADNRARCCPSSWRGQAGRAWCEGISAFVPYQDWPEGDGRLHRIVGLVYDDSVSTSWYASTTAQILTGWRAGHRPGFDLLKARAAVVPIFLDVKSLA